MPKFRYNSSYASGYTSRKEKEREERVQERGNMVIVHNGRDMDSLNDALRRFRKKLEAEGTMDD